MNEDTHHCGVSVKHFLGSPDRGLPGMVGTEYLVYSTVGGSASTNTASPVPAVHAHDMRGADEGSIFVPFAMPLIAGPGAITTVITLTARAHTLLSRLAVPAAVGIVTALLFLSLVSSSWLLAARTATPMMRVRTTRDALPSGLAGAVHSFVIVMDAVSNVIEGHPVPGVAN